LVCDLVDLSVFPAGGENSEGERRAGCDFQSRFSAAGGKEGKGRVSAGAPPSVPLQAAADFPNEGLFRFGPLRGTVGRRRQAPFFLSRELFSRGGQHFKADHGARPVPRVGAKRESA